MFARRPTIGMDPTARFPRRSGAAGTYLVLLPCAVAAILMARNRVADASEPVVGDEAVAAHGEERLVEVDAVADPGSPADVEAGVAADEAAGAAPDASLDGGEVIVVTGTRSATSLGASPVVTEVIDRERLAASGAETVADALALRPGLWLERGIGGTGVTIQGLGPAYVLILVDGQRQIGRVGGAIDLDRLGVEGVEQIEIVRGPGSVLYGSDALGGVVNVITRAPREPGVGGEVGARIDGWLATDLHGRVDGGRGAWRGAAAAQWRRGAAHDRTPADPATTISAYDDARGAAQAAWRDGDVWRVDLGADYLRRDLAGVDATATGAVLDRRNLIEIAQAHAAVHRASARTRARLTAGAGLYRDQFVLEQRGGMSLDRDEETVETLVEGAAQLEHARGRHRVILGAEGLREALDADRLSVPGARWRAAAFVQDEWRAGDAYDWLIVPAARLDHDSQFGTHATPRLAVRWDVTPRVVTRASVGFGFRAPSFKDLLLRFENPGAGYVVEGNPMLRPETSVSGQLGGEWWAHDAVWLAAGVFDHELTDLIAAVTVDAGGAGGPQRFSYDNIGRARSSGAELAAAITRGRAALELGWAWTRAVDREAGRRLEGVPAHRASVAVRWRDPAEGLDALVEATVTGARPYYLTDDPQAATLTARRSEVRARVARRFAGGLTAFLGVDNLLDAGDDHLDVIAPRTLYAGAEARR